MSQYEIISIFPRTISINKGLAKKKNAYLFQYQGHRNKMNLEYLGIYV